MPHLRPQALFSRWAGPHRQTNFPCQIVVAPRSDWTAYWLFWAARFRCVVTESASGAVATAVRSGSGAVGSRHDWVDSCAPVRLAVGGLVTAVWFFARTSACSVIAQKSGLTRCARGKCRRRYRRPPSILAAALLHSQLLPAPVWIRPGHPRLSSLPITSVVRELNDASQIPIAVENPRSRGTARAGCVLIPLAIGYREYNLTFESNHSTSKERPSHVAGSAVFLDLVPLKVAGICCLRRSLPRQFLHWRFHTRLSLADRPYVARENLISGSGRPGFREIIPPHHDVRQLFFAFADSSCSCAGHKLDPAAPLPLGAQPRPTPGFRSCPGNYQVRGFSSVGAPQIDGSCPWRCSLNFHKWYSTYSPSLVAWFGCVVYCFPFHVPQGHLPSGQVLQALPID